MKNKTMLTDFYQLTMMASYVDNDKDDTATFDMFVRNMPKDWGYLIAAGIEDAIDYVTDIRFEQKDIDYIRQQGIFKEDFLDSLKDFRFEGDIYAVKEGTPVFPNEPILRVTAKRTQAQFVESALLNIINFQTLVASKAGRVVEAAKGASVVDFGLRRAHDEDAAMKGAKASYIAGAVATSNVKAGLEYGIPITGTHAHSFVMSFGSEIEAFRAYVKTFPKTSTLLIDTYDTLQGARNAAIVGKELEAAGGRLNAVRIDSGDLCELSKQVRIILDENRLDYVQVRVSNDLNEYKITDLTAKGAPITGYGVGTEMITGKPDAALPGVYKLVEDEDGAKIKLSPGKRTYPSRKQVYRATDADGKYANDILALDHENMHGTSLLELAVKDGIRARPPSPLAETQRYCRSCVENLPDYARELKVQRQYEVKISPALNDVVEQLTVKYGGDGR